MSLFDPKDNQQFIDRIQSLKPETQRQWGKMDVAQMMAHCIQPMKIAFRETNPKRGWFGFFLGKMIKNKYIIQGKDFEKNLPTHPTFIQSDPRDFAEQQSRLLAYVQRWVNEGPAAITTELHPLFGKMTPEEWDKLMSKHLDHHLRQFGA